MLKHTIDNFKPYTVQKRKIEIQKNKHTHTPKRSFISFVRMHDNKITQASLNAHICFPYRVDVECGGSDSTPHRLCIAHSPAYSATIAHCIALHCNAFALVHSASQFLAPSFAAKSWYSLVSNFQILNKIYSTITRLIMSAFQCALY